MGNADGIVIVVWRNATTGLPKHRELMSRPDGEWNRTELRNERLD